ncbi:hypothetical protein Sango_1098700 [Sesamum angolense]|uniref:Uncharacterized protein n=1 Tax=Sesamum angolense TaxID=2727404 RepID=A0AAE1WV03_9LAMI|nr:hypothetical protein Sango_1098700 [Sesamum angolense]
MPLPASSISSQFLHNMDFHGYLRQEKHTTKVYSSDQYFEEDDDTFYDELRRQVLQLTADDDEDAYENKILQSRKQGRKQGLHTGPCSVRQPRCYYNWPGNKEDCAAAPAWMLNLWRSGNGTGVFIPQTVQRKNRSRRKKNEKGRTYKRVEKTN